MYVHNESLIITYIQTLHITYVYMKNVIINYVVCSMNVCMYVYIYIYVMYL